MSLFCPHCNNPLTEVRIDLADIQHTLARIERALKTLGVDVTQEIDDVKAAVDAEAAEVASFDTDVQRLIADFEAKVNGATSLSDADKAELLAVVNEAKANLAAAQSTQAAVDTADPAPAPAAPAEPAPAGDGTAPAA